MCCVAAPGSRQCCSHLEGPRLRCAPAPPRGSPRRRTCTSSSLRAESWPGAHHSLFVRFPTLGAANGRHRRSKPWGGSAPRARAPRAAGVAVTTVGHLPLRESSRVPSEGPPCPWPQTDRARWPGGRERTCPLIQWHWVPGTRRGSYLIEALRPLWAQVTRVTPACGRMGEA